MEIREIQIKPYKTRLCIAFLSTFLVFTCYTLFVFLETTIHTPWRNTIFWLQVCFLFSLVSAPIAAGIVKKNMILLILLSQALAVVFLPLTVFLHIPLGDILY